MNATYCDVCGDFLFNGQHRGHVEIWCRAIRETENPNVVETKIPDAAETENRIGADDETLATQLISAAVTICGGDERGVDDEADLSWDQPVWIGNYFGQEDRGDSRLGLGALECSERCRFLSTMAKSCRYP